jgi:hypothetical protein
VVCAGENTAAVIDLIPDVQKSVAIQTRVCQVVVMRGNVPDASIVVPDAQMFIAPQYAPDGAPVMLYTYGTDPLHSETNHRLDTARLEKQLDSLRATLPGLNAVARHRDVYLARKTESAALGQGQRPNGAFVERLADDVVCVLPTKLSLAINASDQVLSMFDSPRRLTPETAPVAFPPHYNATQVTLDLQELQYA